MTLRLGGDGAITGCTSLENPDLTVSGLTISGSFDAEKVLVASGTAAAPSYTFSGDTDNGLYYAGTNSIGLATAGTNAILIDSSNRVGIGETSPSYKLHVKTGQVMFQETAAASNAVLRLKGSNTSKGGAIIAQSSTNGSAPLEFYSGTSQTMKIDSSGRLLVGTSSNLEDFIFQVDGNTGNTASFTRCIADGATIRIGSSRGTQGSRTALAVNDFGGVIDFDGYTGTEFSTLGRITAACDGQAPATGDSPGRLVFSTTADGGSSPTERMRIDNSGNVKFEYTDSSTSTSTQLPPGLRIYNKDNTNGRLAGIHFSHGGAGTANAGIFHVTTNTATGSTTCLGDLAFYIKANGSSTMTERMRIDSSGRIGIGITSPVQILDIGSSGYAGIGFKSSRTTAADNIGGPVWRNNLNQEKAFIQSTVDGQLKFGAGGATERLRIDSSGNVGVGTSSPRGLLHVGPDLASGATDAARINLKQNGLAATDGIYLERSGERRGYHMFIGAPSDGLTFRANNFGTFTTTMYLDRVGNVGIGTTSPTRKLDISGSGGTSIRIIDTSSYAELSLNGAGTANFIESDDALAYNVGGSERMRILSTGGLTFNGDTAQANALDDYEEGTFTPTLYGGVTAGTFTPTGQNGGMYTKIGNIVYCMINVQGTISGAAGQPRVGGLPFTSAAGGTTQAGNATYSTGSLQYWNQSGADFMGPLNQAGTSYIYFHDYDGDSSGSAQINNAVGHNLHCCVAYRVA